MTMKNVTGTATVLNFEWKRYIIYVIALKGYDLCYHIECLQVLVHKK